VQRTDIISAGINAQLYRQTYLHAYTPQQSLNGALS